MVRIAWTKTVADNVKWSEMCLNFLFAFSNSFGQMEDSSLVTAEQLVAHLCLACPEHIPPFLAFASGTSVPRLQEVATANTTC